MNVATESRQRRCDQAANVGVVSYVVTAVPESVHAELRQRDDAGQAPRVVVDEEGGAPLRCCLRDSSPGERIVLVSYAPLRRWAATTGAEPGPYDEVGPIFIHADPCAGPTETGIPKFSTYRQQVLRAYQRTGIIHGGVLVEPEGDIDGALRSVLADADVEAVHVRNVVFGCFMYEVRRAAG